MCHAFLCTFYLAFVTCAEYIEQLYLAQEICVHVIKIVRFVWLSVLFAGVICCIYCHVCCVVNQVH